jgi:acetate kinase
MTILAINCGSSTLKFDVLARDTEQKTIASGSIDRIGPEAEASLLYEGREQSGRAPIPNHTEASYLALSMLREAGLLDGIDAVGHRVVHGGPRFYEATLLNPDVIEAIGAVSELAPLHNDKALEVIKAVRATLGIEMPMVACFDTAFFTALPEVAATYALPRDMMRQYGIRRFGFHGLAHRYMTEKYAGLRGTATARLITLQLGNGSSASAILNGNPLETSMGFTPLEGLIMGTRSGDIDPSILLSIMSSAGMTPRDVKAMLNQHSGLLGLSGRSSDMRELLQAAREGHKDSQLAVDAFCHRIIKYVGAYMAVLGGLDAIVFGGGIGENSPEIRGSVCNAFAWAGLSLDEATNAAVTEPVTRISSRRSSIEAWVVRVDEAAIIAEETARALG